jgi:DNA-directed RNA polymerase specialized sigma24 family protein
MLEGLPARNRLLMTLLVDGLTVAEIARSVGRSMRTVERVIHITRLELNEILRAAN